MRKIQILLLFVVVLCLAFPQSSFAKDTKLVGKFAEVDGTVELKKGGGKKQFDAVKNMGFTQGDQIRTGTKSKAILHIDSDKKVTVSANTKLVVKQLVKSMDAEEGKTSLSLNGGKVKVKIDKKLKGSSKFEVQTPNAIMGVMGTEFDVAYDGENTYVGVSEGVVKAELPNQDTPIELHPNEFLELKADGTAEVKAFGPAEQQFFNAESNLSKESTVTTETASTHEAARYEVIREEEYDDDDDDDDVSYSSEYERGYENGYKQGLEWGLEDSHWDGYHDGRDQQLESNRPYQEGLAVGAEEGLTDGTYQAGYDEGYGYGYQHGKQDAEHENVTSPTEQSDYSKGWNDGHHKSWNETYPNQEKYDEGYVEGTEDGLNADYDTGVLDGKENVSNEGWSDGYQDGYDDGYEEHKQ
ncbi:MAG: FecR family protein [Solibacillus sp.]